MPPTHHNALAAILARIDQTVERSWELIDAPGDNDTQKQSLDVLGDILHARREVEAKLTSDSNGH